MSSCSESMIVFRKDSGKSVIMAHFPSFYDHPPQFGVICKLSENSHCPITYVFNENLNSIGLSTDFWIRASSIFWKLAELCTSDNNSDQAQLSSLFSKSPLNFHLPSHCLTNLVIRRLKPTAEAKICNIHWSSLGHRARHTIRWVRLDLSSVNMLAVPYHLLVPEVCRASL